MSVKLLKILQDDINSNDDIIDEDIKLLRIQHLKKSNKLKIILKSVSKLNDMVQSKIKEIIIKKLGFSIFTVGADEFDADIAVKAEEAIKKKNG